MPPGTSAPEKYQQAEWVVEFTTDAGNKGRRDELAARFQNSIVSGVLWQGLGFAAGDRWCLVEAVEV